MDVVTLRLRQQSAHDRFSEQHPECKDIRRAPQSLGRYGDGFLYRRWRRVPLWAARRSGSGKLCLSRNVSACKNSRSEEHTSELQSPDHIVCRLLLEKKKGTIARQLECYAQAMVATDNA